MSLAPITAIRVVTVCRREFLGTMEDLHDAWARGDMAAYVETLADVLSGGLRNGVYRHFYGGRCP